MYQQSAESLELSNSVDTQNLVLNLFEGSLHLLRESGQSFNKQKSDVVTPKGTTHAGLVELEKTAPVFNQALGNAYNRAKELGDELNQTLFRNNQ
jgi:pyrroline-5-carboxylate reductase